MLSETRKLWILARSSKDLGIACGDRTATLALERTGHDRCSTRLRSGADKSVDEVDQLIGEAHGDLLAHPITVPDWYRLRPEQSGIEVVLGARALAAGQEAARRLVLRRPR